jgi:hypothetical protein
MHEKFIGHMEAGLKKLDSAAESGRLRGERLASERLGRLKEHFWRASQAFDVTKRHIQLTGWASRAAPSRVDPLRA